MNIIRNFLIILSVFTKLNFCSDDFNEPVIVKLSESGKVVGYKKQPDYIKFENIPYGIIETNGSFHPAKPVRDNLDGIINEKILSLCPSSNFVWTQFSHCLFLEISTKDVNGKNPILIHIPSYDLIKIEPVNESLLMTKDVVFVQLSFRVGAFGFLSTGTDIFPGNTGILDIIDALKWIKKYVGHFGGDPNRITLSGAYHGARLVGVLTKSPLGEGLFNQVIYYSGGFYMKELFSSAPIVTAVHIADKYTNCTEGDNYLEIFENTEYLNKCLLYLSDSDKLNLYRLTMKYSSGDFVTYDGPSGVITTDNEFRSYPTIAGFTTHPSIYIQQIDNKVLKKFGKYNITHRRKLNYPRADFKSIPQFLIDIYGKDFLDGKFNVDNDFDSAYNQMLLAMELDVYGLKIKKSILQVADLNTITLNGTTYLYVHKFPYQYYIKKNSYDILKKYSTIGDDLIIFYPQLYKDKNEIAVANSVLDLWVSFISTGVPKTKHSIEWPQYGYVNQPYLIIDEKLEIGFDIRKEFYSTTLCQYTGNCDWKDQESLVKL